MKHISYLVPGFTSAPCRHDQVLEFAESAGIDHISSTFIEYCTTQNGGSLDVAFAYSVPNQYTKPRLGILELLDVQDLCGLSFNVRFDTRWWTRSYRLQGVPPLGLAKDFWIVGSSGLGYKYVSRLCEGRDEVYVWESGSHPAFEQVSESLADFYAHIVNAGDP